MLFKGPAVDLTLHSSHVSDAFGLSGASLSNPCSQGK